jgi:hypothetical protein
MVKPGHTILYRHIEAVETVKDRPAVVLRVIGDRVLLVIGQTAEPRGANVLVEGRSTGLQYGTYFDCRTVIAASASRILRGLGRVPMAQFNAIIAACSAALSNAIQRATEEAELQRGRLAEAISRHTETTGCSLEDIADRARIARHHLRQIVSEPGTWTRDEIIRIAQVLEVDAATLLDG